MVNTSTAYRVATWKAMPMFAIAGGLLCAPPLILMGLQLNFVVQLILMVYAVGIMPWGLTGALYARFANKSALDLANSQTWVRLGAKAGALTSVTSGVVVGLLVLLGLPAGTLSGLMLAAIPLLLAGMAVQGALGGAVTALVIGRFVLEPKPAV